MFERVLLLPPAPRRPTHPDGGTRPDEEEDEWQVRLAQVRE